MTLEYAAPCGIRPRLALGLRVLGTYALLAEFLDVDAQVIEDCLEDDSFEPDPEDLATMNANLGNIVPEVPLVRRLGFSEQREITVYESPLWDSAQMGEITLPAGTESFRWVF